MDKILPLEKGMAGPRGFLSQVARVKVLETRLLRLGDFLEINNIDILERALERLLEFPDYRKQEKVEFDRVLENQLEKLQDLILELSGGFPAIQPFLLEFDFHNLKIIFSGKNLENYFYPNLGLWGLERIKDFALGKKPEGISPELLEKLQPIKELKDIFLQEIALDRLYYQYCWQVISELNNKFLKDYFALNIDWLNLYNFVKAKQFKWPKAVLNEILLDNGKIDKDLFGKFFEAGLDALKGEIDLALYQKEFEKAIDFLYEKNSFLYFDLGLHRLRGKIMRGVKFLFWGIEPILGYFLNKKEEVFSLNMIFVAKLFGTPSKDRVKENLIYLYGN